MSDAASPARSITLWSQVKVLAASPMAPYYFIIASVSVLVGVGSLMVLSASSVVAQVQEGDPYYYAIRQLRFLVAGVVAALVLSKLKPAFLRRLGWPAWALAANAKAMAATRGHKGCFMNDSGWAIFHPTHARRRHPCRKPWSMPHRSRSWALPGCVDPGAT